MTNNVTPDQFITKTILVVANPTSRGGRAENRFDKVKALFEEYEIPFEFRHTKPNGETSTMISHAVAQEGFRTVVFMGGDGTFNEVAKGVCGSGLPREVRIGMLPSGTANDQGKSFGIESSGKALRKNVEIIAAGHITDLDVGEITAYSENDVVMRRDLFFDSVGWGLSAAILSFRNQELENVKKVPVVRDMYRDQAVYVRAAAHELALTWVTRDRFDVVLELDGKYHHLEGLTDLVISNTSIYAGEWIVDLESSHNDGMFEVQPFHGVRDWASKLVLHHKKVQIPEKLVKGMKLPDFPSFKAAEIKGKFIKPSKKKKLLAQLDGEEFLPADHFKIKIHKRMLRLIVPEDFHWI